MGERLQLVQTMAMMLTLALTQTLEFYVQTEDTSHSIRRSTITSRTLR